MKSFIHDDFLLQNEFAKVLYHDYAKGEPIVDFHCHLPPEEIAENKMFQTITDVWLKGDHYKWRALRAFGVDEYYITGKASDKEKFREWAKVVPKTIGNPLYHWTHLELKRYFGIDDLLSEDNYEQVWEQCNSLLKTDELSVHGMITQSNVEVICTTDDPADDLVNHTKVREDTRIQTKVLPTFRPDEIIDIEKDSFTSYLEKLEKVTRISIQSLQDLLDVIDLRIEYFHERGCRVSDHGPQRLPFKPCSTGEAERVFQNALSGKKLLKEEIEKYKTYILVYLGKKYHAKKWVMQLHIGAIRNNNKRMYDQAGANTGFDSIDDFSLAEPLNLLLNKLDQSNELPKTIIYNLNPTHNEIVASTIGNFHTGGISGKVQFGSGWWFNDQKRGMERQLNDLAHINFLSHFVGMLTDSRSFLSFTRHEYFRRILCNLVGGWMEDGEIPEDYHLAGSIVKNISYQNAKQFFNV